MRRFEVILRSASKIRSVIVNAPNMDCAFWVALYTIDPEDKNGYREKAIYEISS